MVKQLKGFRRVIIYDDEIATGGSIVTLCELLVEHGIKEIFIVCTHGLFIGDAVGRLRAIPQIREIVMTDTVPFPPEKKLDNMVILSVAPIFGEAIRRNYTRQSIGDLFAFWENE